LHWYQQWFGSDVVALALTDVSLIWTSLPVVLIGSTFPLAFSSGLQCLGWLIPGLADW